MIRRLRCRECGSTFYTSVDNPVRECQDCTESHDDTQQAKQDAEAILKINARPPAEEAQSVDPRNPTPRKGRKAKETPSE